MMTMLKSTTGVLLALFALDTAVAANNPTLLGPVRDYFRHRFAVLSAEAGFERAAIVNLATEGLWIMEMLQISPFEGAERDRALDALRRFAKGETVP